MLAHAVPSREPTTKIVGRVHEIPELDTWTIREPDDRPWEDADRWRRVEDAAAEAERQWRTLRIRLQSPIDDRIRQVYRELKDCAIGLATGAVGAVERAEIMKQKISELLKLLHAETSRQDPAIKRRVGEE